MDAKHEIEARAAKLLRMVAEGKTTVDSNYFWKVTFAMEAIVKGETTEAIVYLNAARADVRGIDNAIEYYESRRTGTNVETANAVTARLEGLRAQLKWVTV